MNICIAEHHFFILEGIKSVLCENTKCTIIKVVQSSEEVESISFNREADILILDLDMPGLDVGKTVERILFDIPEIKILAMSDIEDEKLVKDAMQAGATGFIFMKSGGDELVSAIEEIYGGNQYLCENALSLLVKNNDSTVKKSPADGELTNRELQVLELICSEFTNREIAERLGISVRTVDSHRRNILRKTGSNNTAGMVRYAFKRRICRP